MAITQVLLLVASIALIRAAPLSDDQTIPDLLAIENVLYPTTIVEQPPMPHELNWAVKDADSKNDYAHEEKSDGIAVTGSYRVLLPDGRTQIVAYKADENGYVATVRYEGTASYPETKPSYNKQTPSYSTVDTSVSVAPARPAVVVTEPIPLVVPSIAPVSNFQPLEPISAQAFASNAGQGEIFSSAVAISSSSG